MTVKEQCRLLRQELRVRKAEERTRPLFLTCPVCRGQGRDGFLLQKCGFCGGRGRL